jgi:hypothetical protein
MAFEFIIFVKLVALVDISFQTDFKIEKVPIKKVPIKN